MIFFLGNVLTSIPSLIKNNSVLGMYRFRQEILYHKKRVGIPSTPLNGGKT